MKLVIRYLEDGRERAWEQPCEDPAAEARAFALNHDLGAGEWIGAEVVEDSGQMVARLAYNGKSI